MFKQILPDLYQWEDTCNVYVLKHGDSAVLVEFGSGEVLQRLGSIGVRRVTDILLTHHHRDCVQGLEHAPANARLWVPYTEQDLFARVEEHWQGRPLWNHYNPRQDRFSSLHDLMVTGTLRDYERFSTGWLEIHIQPTPGHTVGSISLLGEIHGMRVAFCGDLLTSGGKLWSLAATEWNYAGAEGVAASLASLLDLKEWGAELLLPSHGEVIREPVSTIDLLVERIEEFLKLRGKNTRLRELRACPYERITPHLLMNRTSLSNSYVLLSESGKALLIDYGYDFNTDLPAGTDRASRRPWLYSLPELKRQFGVSKIDVVIPTHYHDDHVAGIELLRRVEGTRCWATENIAPLLERPGEFDLPCLWYDPIPVDRRLRFDQPFEWEEYRLEVYPLRGHTRYEAAIAFEADGQRVLAVGDQYQGDDGLGWNYSYANGFSQEDYRKSVKIYRKVNPSLILPGHWKPVWVNTGYLDLLEERAERLAELHRNLLPEDLGGDGWAACLRPYHIEMRAGEWQRFEVEIENVLGVAARAVVKPVLPSGWRTQVESIEIELPAGGSGQGIFNVVPPEGLQRRRERIAVELWVNGKRLGQRAEALITVRGDSAPGR